MSEETKPSVLVLYYTLSRQTGRVAVAMAEALEGQGCDVTKAPIEFTDERWVPKLSEFPMKHPFPQIVSILPAQLRHKTGEIRIPPEAQSGDYDLVVLVSPTWWFQTSMPMRSYLESPEAKAVLDGKPFACASVSRRYYSINLGQMKKLGEKNGGRFIDETHFVVAGGQVKSMLSWLGYMKHGEPQARVFGLKMPPPNLKPDFEEQASAFVDGVAESVLRQPALVVPWNDGRRFQITHKEVAMAIGPVQLLVLGFEHPDFHGEVIEELERLRATDTIRVIDALAVHKDAAGEIEVMHLSNLTRDEAVELGSKVAALIGLGIAGEEGMEEAAELGAERVAEQGGIEFFSDEDAWDVLEDIPNDSAAALLLIEHHWAVPLRDAIVRAGGFRISEGFISPLDLVAIGEITAAEAEELNATEKTTAAASA